MKISILIPCHNEEKSVKACVESCLNQTRKLDQIVVVNDGSTDKTLKILKRFGRKIEIVNLYPATGNKSYAQEAGLRSITGDVCVMTDGDTVLDENFVKRMEIDFADPKVAAVAGYVRSRRYNWLTACRAYEYVIGQDIHKLAQSLLNFIFVIPGAAGAFRTKIFKKIIGFDHDTVTEDLDFTYKLHKHNLKIKYDRQAIVFTQDPPNLKSYINQIRRWYGGGCQNLVKHLNRDLVDDPRRVLELSLIYVDGLAFSFLMYMVPLINVTLAFKYFLVFFVFLVLQSIYASAKERRLDMLMVPFYYTFLMFLNSAIFIERFVVEIVLRRKKLAWLWAERVEV